MERMSEKRVYAGDIYIIERLFLKEALQRVGDESASVLIMLLGGEVD